MKVLNFGSLNLDYVYQVDHFVQPGETLHAMSQTVNCGGKGLNQSIALARAGANVYHAGCVGVGGERLIQKLEANYVDVTYIDQVEELQGNAIIQVDKSGENSILLFGGSNQVISPEQVAKVLNSFEEGDYIILQNETSCLKEMISSAARKKMKIVLNPSPFEESLRFLDYSAVLWLLVNEVEAAQISGEAQPEAAWKVMHEKYPSLNMVITMGSAGSVCYMPDEMFVQPAYKVKAVDTTAAGDTFAGYFLASLMSGKPVPACMERAAKASAVSVQRHRQIPYLRQTRLTGVLFSHNNFIAFAAYSEQPFPN